MYRQLGAVRDDVRETWRALDRTHNELRSLEEDLCYYRAYLAAIDVNKLQGDGIGLYETVADILDTLRRHGLDV